MYQWMIRKESLETKFREIIWNKQMCLKSGFHIIIKKIYVLFFLFKVFYGIDSADEMISPSYLLAHKFVHLRPNQLSEDCYSQCLTSEWDPWLEWNISFNRISTYLIQNMKLFRNFKNTYYMEFIRIHAIFVTLLEAPFTYAF